MHILHGYARISLRWLSTGRLRRSVAAKVGADAQAAREQLRTERERSGALTLHSGALQQARPPHAPKTTPAPQLCYLPYTFSASLCTISLCL